MAYNIGTSVKSEFELFSQQFQGVIEQQNVIIRQLKSRVSTLETGSALFRALEGIVTGHTGTLASQASTLTSQATTIASNTSLVGGFTSSINTLTTASSGFNSRIGTLETGLGSTNTNVNNNSTSIGNLNTSVGNNSTSIGNLNTSVGINTTAIQALDTTTSNSFTAINSTLQTHTTNFSTNNTKLTNLRNNVTTLQSNTSSNATSIGGLVTSRNQHDTRITNNTNTVSGFDSRITQNTNTVSGFDSRITNNTNTVSGFNSRITTNTDEISSVRTLANQVLIATQVNGDAVFNLQTQHNNEISGISTLLGDFNQRADDLRRDHTTLVSQKNVILQDISNHDLQINATEGVVVVLSNLIYADPGGILYRLDDLVDAINLVRFEFGTTYMNNIFGPHVILTEKNNKEVTLYLQRNNEFLRNPQEVGRGNNQVSHTTMSHTRNYNYTNLLATLTFRCVMREHSDQFFNFKIVLNIGESDEQEGVATEFKITNDYTLHYYEVSLQLRTTNLKITQRMTNNFTLRISNHHASGSRMDSINWLIQEFV